MPTIEIEIDVWCTCGNGLCNQSTPYKKGVQVEPCEKCLEKAKQQGYLEAHAEGPEEEA